ncbi:MAG: NADPH-dependent 7-cyano-7-deazaguanine reductase QueF [Candidatus Anaerobiospirillum merdipullorum]|uniref:NADPH-dependent 7-cyano-7-deazaguanine reductase QueF n=1 Tax=Candidatus Anaerobiospirillum merdipullorum TaxID=2838450 RepID=A0A9E2NRS1_9GAMM|nr:NADPH-dependent 7-cyano-7-deazaguanine reductase QueF [Candidatus Anaerobiospirillum merdipullorum]
MEKLQPTLLGQATTYYDEYCPGLLEPISRTLGRAGLKYFAPQGYDLWRIYELTFLNKLNIPCGAMGTICVPASSAFIVESKSLKLYLGSFTQTKFSSLDEVEQLITHDLSKVLECEVKVKLYDVDSTPPCFVPQTLAGKLIDLTSGVTLTNFAYHPELLTKHDGPRVEEVLRSNLLRTLCPVTGQPDHASIQIHYQGVQVNHQELFAYLMSLRLHRGFHEQCVELIYNDLKSRLKLDKLEVLACFTRRGGIDINPLRTDFDLDDCAVIRTLRQ